MNLGLSRTSGLPESIGDPFEIHFHVGDGLLDGLGSGSRDLDLPLIDSGSLCVFSVASPVTNANILLPIVPREAVTDWPRDPTPPQLGSVLDAPAISHLHPPAIHPPSPFDHFSEPSSTSVPHLGPTEPILYPRRCPRAFMPKSHRRCDQCGVGNNVCRDRWRPGPGGAGSLCNLCVG